MTNCERAVDSCPCHPRQRSQRCQHTLYNSYAADSGMLFACTMVDAGVLGRQRGDEERLKTYIMQRVPPGSVCRLSVRCRLVV